MGVDIGLNKLLTAVIFDPNKEKPFFVRIVKDEAFNMRIKRRKQLYYLRGKKNKRQKIKRMRNIESRINQFYHKRTKDIINWALNNNAAIVLEDLKDMKKKSRIRERKEIKYKLSQFVYKTIRSMIEYKAKMYGLPIIFVDPVGTSYTCSKCGSTNTSRPKQAIFMCNNSECILNKGTKQRQINADYNAACNIANKGLKTNEWKSIIKVNA
jgi:putative transposase